MDKARIPQRSLKKPLILFLAALALILSSCAPKCRDFSRFGADEFVIDSYKIKEGKLAILEMQGKPLVDVPCESMIEFKDVIAEDDVLTIAVYHPTRKDFMENIRFINETVGGFKVNNGRVDLPDIPPVLIAGLTLEEARLKIQDEFGKQIRDTEVFVAYKSRRARKVELTGLVSADSVTVDGKTRLYEVISKARIPPNANFYDSYIVRDGCKLGIDLHKLIHEGDMCQNIVMQGGDKIFIAKPSDSLVMIMGEVGLPKPVEAPYGFISLREALVSAHGIPFTGDKRNIQVIRGNLPCPKIYTLCWEHIIHLPNDSLLLIPGDTVYVSETPLTRWNRFIDQLLPSVSGLQAGYALYRLTD